MAPSWSAQGTVTTLDAGPRPAEDQVLAMAKTCLESSICELCDGVEVTPLHAVQDCTFSQQVWTLLLAQGHQQWFWHPHDPQVWIVENLKALHSNKADEASWENIFCRTMQVLWYRCNRTIMQHSYNDSVFRIVRGILITVWEILSTPGGRAHYRSDSIPLM